MPIYKYRAVVNEAEAVEESGSLIARDERGARDKLKALGMTHIHLRELHGLKALLNRFRADFR